LVHAKNVKNFNDFFFIGGTYSVYNF